ncbi:MAG: hypothetical protein AAF389_03770 [Gemmatimonadota bacterium]
MFGFFRRRRERAERIRALIDTDVDRAAEELSASGHRLDADERGHLAGLVRQRLQAREHLDYLTRALAERTISATAACELIETYTEAGYLDEPNSSRLRRHAFEAHRREVEALMISPNASPSDYFTLIDGYRSAGYLSTAELTELERMLDVKLNPAMAASRLFAEIRVTLDQEVQIELLDRYLKEFEGFPDYPEAASLLLALRLDELWKVLPTLRHAREAAVAIHEINNLLVAYLPYTSDIGDSVPVERLVQDFLSHASDFKPEPDVDGPITVRHLRRSVVVAEKHDAAEGTHEYERNQFVSIGAKGRVVAVRDHQVIVAHGVRGLPYSKSWELPDFAGTQYARLHPKSSLAAWRQDELGLVKHRTPSPVFVHQFKEAVHSMEELLERHRADHSLEAPAPLPQLPKAGD